jgi:hypothetical protein
MKRARRETPLDKPCLCPHCGAKLDASTELGEDDAAPIPGDYSMCLHCGCILIYKPDMTMRRAELEDLAEMPKDALLLLMRAQMAQSLAQNRLPPKKPESEH